MNMSKKKSIRIEIKNIEKLSFNKYNGYHWGKKKKFKDNLRDMISIHTKNRLHLDGGYNLSFEFYFVGRVLDNVNVFHYIKIIEDFIFIQDKDNGFIKTENFKSDEEYNYVIIYLEEI